MNTLEYAYTTKCLKDGCTARLDRGVRYCDHHDWQVDLWLKQSLKHLAQFKKEKGAHS